MKHAAHDLKYAVRLAGRHPGFTALVVLTLGLGIGANTALFSVIDAVWLRAVPYPQASRMVMVWSSHPPIERWGASWRDYEAWAARTDVFAHLTALDNLAARVVLNGEVVPIPAPLVRPALFAALNERPVRGRLLDAADANPGAAPVTVVSRRFWQGRLGGREDVVGATVDLMAEGAIVPVRIVGVVGPRFTALVQGDLIRPLPRPSDGGSRRDRVLVMGWLQPGVSIRQAQSAIDEVSARLAEASPETSAGWRGRVESLRDHRVGVDVGRTLSVLTIAVGFVLLIACANVANLLLAEMASRDREMAVRAAVGAARGRLARQLLTESVLLGGAGVAVGLLFVWLTRDALVAVMPRVLPGQDDIGIDTRVLLFTIGIGLAAAVAAGLWPAVRLSRANPGVSLVGRAEHRRAGASRLLVGAEMAIAIVVVVSAVLIVRSFTRLVSVDPGFDPNGVVVFNALPLAGSGSPASAGAGSQLLEELRRLPIVAAAGGVDILPVGAARATYAVRIEGRPEPPRGQEPLVDQRRATPGYFAAMRIPLVEGRTFTEADRPGSPPVVVVNRTAARQFWPGESAIGKRMFVGGMLVTVVGVVGDVRQRGLDQDALPEVYKARAQEPRGILVIAARAAGDPAPLLAALQAPDRRFATGLRLTGVRTLDEHVMRSVREPRFRMALFATLGALVLVLTTAGVAGVTAYAVTRRTREIGIRLALGARRGQVLRLMLLQSAAPAFAGAAVGLVASFWTTRLIERFLFDVPARDPSSLALAALLLFGTSLAAALLPARKATRVDPAETLRAE